MRVSKWLMKKGYIGKTTRYIIKAYHFKKGAAPDLSDREIFRSITKLRYNIIGDNIDPVFVGTVSKPKTLREYIKGVVIYDRLPESINSAEVIMKVIDEICDEERIEIVY